MKLHLTQTQSAPVSHSAVNKPELKKNVVQPSQIIDILITFGPKKAFYFLIFQIILAAAVIFNTTEKSS